MRSRAHPDRPRVLAALKANAEALAADGAVGLSTSCGFLALYQKDLEALSPVPVATSALLLIKTLAKGRNGRRAHGIGSESDAGALRGRRRAADTPVVGLPRTARSRATFLRNGLTLDRDAVERETVAAGTGAARQASRGRHHRARMHQPAALQDRR